MNKHKRKKNSSAKITEEECWNLDVNLAKYILPRLIKFKEINVNSYPSQFSGVEEWHDIIDKMICAFDIVSKHSYDYINEELYKKYEEGMKLFAEYFSCLWD